MDNNFATKYRPTTFAEVVGQEIPKGVLRKIAQFPGIACRSIFLKGSWGSGKTTLARIFAAAMNCESFRTTGDVCNKCSACKEVRASNSQLYMEFDATTAGNIESIRMLHDKLVYVPQGRRVVVLDEVHACSSAALNALLKLVEEGVPSTIFVFCSTEDILPTLKSRSVCLDITTIPAAAMSVRLRHIADKEGIQLSEEALVTICNKSMGHMRDAVALLQLYSMAGEDALCMPYETVLKYVVACLRHNKEEALETRRELLKSPVTDISMAIAVLIKNIFLANTPGMLYSLHKAGLATKLFGFFYSPVAQQAMKSEAGIELLLMSFYDKTNKAE